MRAPTPGQGGQALGDAPEDDAMQHEKGPIRDWDIRDGGIKGAVAGQEISVRCGECAAKAAAEARKGAVHAG